MHFKFISVVTFSVNITIKEKSAKKGVTLNLEV